MSADGTRPETITAAPKPHPPGVVFGMPAQDYHADPSLSASGIKDILVDPAVFYWNSHMNPNRPPDRDTPARQEGRALHKLVLEGACAFEAGFIAEPEPAAYPGCLVTAKDFEAYCREKEIKGYSGKAKAELVRLVKAHSQEVPIWDDIIGLFRAMVERDRMEVLKPETLERVRQAGSTIQLNPHLAKAFRGGAPEVSVFYVDEQNIPCKIRPDFLKPKTIVDLKKFANQRSRPVDVAVKLAIAEYRYDVAARHYLDGYRHLVAAVREGRVFGDCPLPKGWERQLADPDAISWTWVFHQTDGAPVTLGHTVHNDSPVFNRARREIALAKRRYLECLDKFGTGLWISDRPITELADTDLPMWLREETEVL